jgi:hypothetical protein
VTLVNLSLANLDWYLKQLATRPIRPFDPERAPPLYRRLAPAQPPAGAALPVRPDDIAGLKLLRLDQDAMFRAKGIDLPLRQGQVLRIADQVILFTLASYLPDRPVAFGISSGRGSWLGLDPHLVLQGLVYKVVAHPDSLPGLVRGVQGTMVDSARTAYLADSTFHYGKFFTTDSLDLEPAARQVAASFSVLFVELGNAAAVRSDQRQALAYLRRAYHLNPSPALAQVIQRIETEGVQSLFRR